MDKIDNYLEHLYEQESIQSLVEASFEKDFGNVFADIKNKKIFKKIQSNIDLKNPVKSLKKIKSIIPKLPKVKVSTIDKYMTSRVKEYKSLKNTANAIITNSLSGISKESKEAASSFLAISSLFAKKNEKITPKDNLKRNIKTFVVKVRKFGEEYSENEDSTGKLQKEDLPDLAVAWVIVVMSTALAIGLGSGLYGVLASLAGLIGGIGAGTFILASFLLLAYLIHLGKS